MPLIRKEALKANVISAGKKEATIITSADQIWVGEDIKDALSYFLNRMDDKNSKPIKAICIKHKAPPNSHEVAVFSSEGIPVYQMDDLKNITEWVKAPNPVIVLDPQIKIITNLSSQIKNTNDVEKALYDANFIVKLPPRESSKPIVRSAVSTINPSVAVKGLFLKQFSQNKKTSLDDFNKMTQSQKKLTGALGDLIYQANSQDAKIAENAINMLLPYLYSRLPEDPKARILLPLESTGGVIKQKVEIFRMLNEKLQLVKEAEPGKSNQEAHLALQNILMICYRLAHSKQGLVPGSAHNKLFKQAIIVVAEIYACLEKLSKLDISTTKNSVAVNALRTEYLDLLSSLTGLINSPSSEALYVTSLHSIAEDNKAILRTFNIPEVSTLSSEQKAYFIEFMRMQKVALTEKIKKEWLDFVLKVIKNPEQTQELSMLLKFSLANGIESDCLHDSFARAAAKSLDPITKVNIEKSIKEAQQNLILLDEKLKIDPNNKNLLKFKNNLEQHLKNAQAESQSSSATGIITDMKSEAMTTLKELKHLELEKKKLLIKAWERRLNDWSTPSHFDKLWKQYETEILPLIDQLSIESAKQPLAKNALLKTVLDLTELMDRTIKALKGSPQYAEHRQLQAQRFATLLEPYHKLMKKWVRSIPDNYFQEWSKFLNDNNVKEFQEYNLKKGMLDEIDKAYKLKTEQVSTAEFSKQLNPSDQLSVASARVGGTTSFYRQFVLKVSQLTLEDLFTLTHQNILSAVILQTKTILQDKEKNLPEVLMPLHKNMLAISSVAGRNLTEKSTAELMSITHQYPLLNLDYNLALRNHSGKFLVSYNQETQKVTVDLNLFGNNWFERMNKISRFIELQSFMRNDNFLKKVRFNKMTLTLEARFEVDVMQLPLLNQTLSKDFSEYCEMTMTIIDPDTHVQRYSSYLSDLIETYKGSNLMISILSRVHKSRLIQFLTQMPTLMSLQKIMSAMQKVQEADAETLIYIAKHLPELRNEMLSFALLNSLQNKLPSLQTLLNALDNPDDEDQATLFKTIMNIARGENIYLNVNTSPLMIRYLNAPEKNYDMINFHPKVKEISKWIDLDHIEYIFNGFLMYKTNTFSDLKFYWVEPKEVLMTLSNMENALDFQLYNLCRYSPLRWKIFDLLGKNSLANKYPSLQSLINNARSTPEKFEISLFDDLLTFISYRPEVKILPPASMLKYYLLDFFEDSAKTELCQTLMQNNFAEAPHNEKRKLIVNAIFLEDKDLLLYLVQLGGLAVVEDSWSLLLSKPELLKTILSEASDPVFFQEKNQAKPAYLQLLAALAEHTDKEVAESIMGIIENKKKMLASGEALTPGFDLSAKIAEKRYEHIMKKRAEDAADADTRPPRRFDDDFI